MKRKVLIIINPGDDPDDTDHYCYGVFVDADNYRSYFLSPYGGAWSTDEIETLVRPTLDIVKQRLIDLNNAEFSIIIFCGHGFYSAQSRSNILHLCTNQSIDSLDLKEGATKRIIILDSCRKVDPEYITESLNEVRMFTESIEKLDFDQCKRFYLKEISDCQNQIVTCFGASIGEYANDDSDGGFYSSSLLSCAKDWVDKNIKTVNLKNNYRSYSIVSSHNDSAPFVTRRSGGHQNPKIEKPRMDNSSKYLPFIILA